MKTNKKFIVSGIFNLRLCAKDARDATYKAQDMVSRLDRLGFDCCVICTEKATGKERRFGDKPMFD